MNQNLMLEAPETLRPGLLEIEKNVGQALMYLSILPHRRGYAFIKEGVLQLLFSHEKGEPCGTDLYGAIAHRHCCSQKSVESSIRSAIKAAEDMGAYERINALLGVSVAKKSCPLSNLQFLALLSQHCYHGARIPKADAEK